MSNPKQKAIVVGAGLVGTLWAVLLAKRGYQVEVYERRSDMRQAGFAGGRSINLAMSDRGWKALRKAGIADIIRKDAIPMKGRMMHSRQGDLTFQPYGKEDQAIFAVSRGGLNLELIKIADSFDNVHFHFNRQCTGVELDSKTLKFENEKSNAASAVAAPLLFGTDGAFSSIRGSMQKTNRYNYSQQYLQHGYKELTIPPYQDGSFRMDKNALHIWPRGNFMLIALPNVDGTFTCTLFMPFEGDNSFEQLDSHQAVRQFFQYHFPDTIPLIPDLESDFKTNPTSSLVTIKADPWHYGDGIVLLGDAAHAIVPFYGQGMNAGFEDCSILDEMADEYGEDWPAIIEAFSQRHVRNGHAIADLAIRNFIEMRDKVADPKFLLRKKIAAWLHEKYPDFLPVYTMVTFSHLPYHRALEESFEQDAFFEEILALPNIEQRWNSTEVEAIFKEWWAKKKVQNAQPA